jgi:hypothetical protein
MSASKIILHERIKIISAIREFGLISSNTSTTDVNVPLVRQKTEFRCINSNTEIFWHIMAEIAEESASGGSSVISHVTTTTAVKVVV